MSVYGRRRPSSSSPQKRSFSIAALTAYPDGIRGGSSRPFGSEIQMTVWKRR
jgi:hypothetical protein